MAHRVDGVLVGYPIATPSLRISTRVPRDQRTPGPNSLGPVCPVPTVPSTARGTYKYVSLWSSARIRVAGSSQPPSRQPQQSYDARVRVEKNGFYRSSSEASASASDDDDASTGSSSYESYTASSASYSGASDDDSAGAASAAGAAGAGAAAGAGTAYAAGGHSAELDYTGPELAHSAELDYQSPV